MNLLPVIVFAGVVGIALSQIAPAKINDGSPSKAPPNGWKLEPGKRYSITQKFVGTQPNPEQLDAIVRLMQSQRGATHVQTKRVGNEVFMNFDTAVLTSTETALPGQKAKMGTFETELSDVRGEGLRTYFSFLGD